jgi:hypothetical protein
MQRIEITHTTRYSYATPVRFLPHKLHVRPREGHDIRIESSQLRIAPDYDISGQRVGGDHIAVAVHRHPEAIPPVSGRFVGPSEPFPQMDVAVGMRRL